MPTYDKYSAQVNKLVMDALKVSDDGFGVFNQQDMLVFCNKSMADLFNVTIDEALGTSFEALLRTSASSGNGVIADDGDIDALVKRAVHGRLQRGYKSFESDRSDGTWRLISRLRTDNDYIFIYSTDITILKETEAHLRETLCYVNKLASTDSLTGISNRRHFLESSKIEYERSQRYQHPLSMLALDIDHFKSINDNYGHQAGDKVLEAISQCCTELIRNSDIFGRLGGEEFSILLPETNAKAAKEIAQRVLNAMSSLKVKYKNQEIRLTTSIGVAHVTKQCKNLEELMKNADDALYKAKHNGRNRMEIWR